MFGPVAGHLFNAIGRISKGDGCTIEFKVGDNPNRLIEAANGYHNWKQIDKDTFDILQGRFEYVYANEIGLLVSGVKVAVYPTVQGEGNAVPVDFEDGGATHYTVAIRTHMLNEVKAIADFSNLMDAMKYAIGELKEIIRECQTANPPI